MMDLVPTRVTGVRDGVCEQLRDAIVAGRLPAGTRLVEMEIASKLGVSKTPVREALLHLERVGLVVSHPRRGAVVAAVNPDQVDEILTLRFLIEGYVTEQACRVATPADLDELRQIVAAMREAGDRNEAQSAQDIAFHDVIYQLSGNALLNEVWQIIRSRLALWHTLGRGYRVRAGLPPNPEWHTVLLDAFTSGDAEMAREAALEHIRQARRIVAMVRAEDSVIVQTQGGRSSPAEGRD